MEWCKMWPNGILRGSLCTEDDSVQLVWLKLLCIASETHVRNGRLEFRKGRPMSHKYLINYLHTTPLKFNKAIDVFKKDIGKNNKPRITVEDDGTIVITNWKLYQEDNREPYKKPPMDEKQKIGMTRSLVNQ